MSVRLRIRRLSESIGLILVALLVVAAGARAAGEWKIAEQTMTELEAPEASISGTASETFKLSVAWYASEIECSTLATEAPTKIFKGGTSEAILKLSSCKILGSPFVSETCKLIEPIELKVVGELLLHGGKTYELFKAPTGKTSLGMIKFKEGTECPLPLSNELKGTFVGETEAGERKEQPLTFNSTVEALFGEDDLSFGTHPATLKGKSVWVLAAGYKGLKWAAVGEESKEEKELEKEKLEEEEEKALKTKWLLLSNGIPVNELKLGLEGLEVLLKTENGFQIKCTGAEGTATAKLVEEGKKVTASASATFEGCVWVGGEKTCIINNEFEESVGEIFASGTGEVVMPDATTYILSAASEEFGTVYTEGAFCMLPEEQAIHGSAHVLIKGELPVGTPLSGQYLALALKLGLSKAIELTGEAHIFNEVKPTATVGIHLGS